MTDHAQAVLMAYHCVLFLVDEDATREVAENAIDNAPKLRRGMSFAVRNAVLDMFEPTRDPIPGLDFFPPADALPVQQAPAWGEWPS